MHWRLWSSGSNERVGARDIRTDLQSRYGLTNAEAKIAEALSHGGSLAQIADRFGIAH
jgi:DNA-binding CsgD family transcriptional regulator